MKFGRVESVLACMCILKRIVVYATELDQNASSAVQETVDQGVQKFNETLRDSTLEVINSYADAVKKTTDDFYNQIVPDIEGAGNGNKAKLVGGDENVEQNPVQGEDESSISDDNNPPAYGDDTS